MTIDRDLYTKFVVKFKEGFEFEGIEKVILTIKNELNGEPLITREFYDANPHVVVITPEEAALLNFNEKTNSGTAYYDFDAVYTNGEKIKISPNRRVDIARGVGSIYDDL